jgi:hypothetical protein
MINPRRGEIEAVIGGQKRRLCLTLGALAGLEARFGAGDLGDLAERFEQGRVSARDLAAIIAAGLAGGGDPMSEDDVLATPIEGGIEGAARIALALLTAAFGTDRDQP